MLNRTRNSSQRHRHTAKTCFSVSAPICGPLALEQFCTLAYSRTQSCRGRFLPCLAGMVMTATETFHVHNALFKMCLNDSGIVMLTKEVHPSKAKFPMCVTDSPKVMFTKEVQSSNALSPMWVTDSPKAMLPKEVQFWKAELPMCVTDSPKVMLAKEVQFWKAHSRMWVTDSGIVTKTSWREFWKADGEICFRLQGIFTPKHPCVWMSLFVAASTSFLVYATVTRGSAPMSPASSSDSASFMIKLSRSSSTLRTLRSIGSWQGCFSRSIAFNSRTVAGVTTSRVMTLPCKVFNLTSQDMAPQGQLRNRVASKMVDYGHDMAKEWCFVSL